MPLLRFFQRHLVVIGFVVSLLILVIGLFSFILPRYTKVQELGGLNYNQKRAELETKQQYLDDLRALRANLNLVTPEDLERVNLVVPRGKDIPGIFSQMQEFAKEAKMELLSVAVSDGSTVSSTGATGSVTNASSQLRTVSVSVVLGGALNYEGLKSFLNVVSRQAPILDLTAISYAPGAGTSQASYKFSFRSYFLEP
jgi:hypothetical protein